MSDVASPPRTLMDLIARTWSLSGPVELAVFNAHASTIAFLGGGTLALASLADPERPDARVRYAADDGRHTISPRQKPVSPPLEVRNISGPIVPFGEKSFLTMHGKEGLVSVTPRGQVVPIRLPLDEAPTAMARDPVSGAIAIGVGSRVIILPDSDPTSARSIAIDAPVTALAYAPDGARLAIGRDGGVAFAEGDILTGGVAFDGEASHISFHPDGHVLACGLDIPGFALVQTGGMTGETVMDYPTPVRSFAWNTVAGILATSGAFRTVAWKIEDGDLGDGVQIGRNGLVVVERVASSPDRPLIATGYASGLLCLAQVGNADEMLLRADGASITALTWCSDGVHLAMGDSAGQIALFAFPRTIFK